MRITAISSPRHVATIARQLTLHLRVTSGAVLIAREQQDLLAGGGLPIAAADGIQSLDWDTGQLWVQGDPAGTFEVVLP